MRAVLLGLAIAAAILALFHLAGSAFFVPTRLALNANLAVATLLGAALGWFGPGLTGARASRGERVLAMALIASPGMLILAAVGSHVGLVFPQLPRSMDKSFGALALWFYAVALIAAALRR